MLNPQRHPVATWLAGCWQARDYVLLAVLVALAVFFAGLSLLRRQALPVPPVEQPSFHVVNVAVTHAAPGASAGWADSDAKR